MDLLTGKAKTDFEAWIHEQYPELMDRHSGHINYFNHLAHTAFFAHVLEWLDSVGIDAYVRILIKDGTWLSVVEGGIESTDCPSRFYATEAAIIKSVELYNDKV